MPRSSASIRTQRVTIPTYPVGPADLNPIFYSDRMYQGAKGPIYPYPMLDTLSDAAVPRAYDAIYLENEYIEFSVLPEIGGRIFTALDKTDSYDFFYRQTVIKPALIGMIGAWLSGGVEWNVPHHHRPSTFMPVDYLLAENADGSKTLHLSEVELRHRMKWLVSLTIRPGRSLIEITVKLFNRTPFIHSFLYFTNAAVHVNPSYQVVFPPDVEFGTQHAKAEFIRWPFSREVYAGMDYTSGVDVSYWNNHPNWLSIFAFESRSDFFGGYDHSRDAGVVHFADHHVSPGKKFFTFSPSPGGRMWDEILTDSDGPYLELMAGSYSDNQPDYSWIAPGETKTVTEWWYPVRGLGGLAHANRDAAVNLTLTGRSARIALNATAAFAGATVVLKSRDSVLFERRIDIAPDAPFAHTLDIRDAATEYDLSLALYSADGREIISYRRERREASASLPAPVTPPPAPADAKTNEELCLAGLRLEQFHNAVLEPEPYYREALRRDPSDYRANVALATLLLKRALAADAETLLQRAVARATSHYTRPRDGEALYYLGLARLALGKTADARDAFNRAAWSYAFYSASHLQLAVLDAADADFDSALASVERAISCNALSSNAHALKAAILRRLGRTDDAARAAQAALDIDPLDFFAANELLLAARAASSPDAQKQSARLAALMRADLESHLELAWDYAGSGLDDEAIDVLSRITPQPPEPPAHPMLHYALGFLADRGGRPDISALHFSLAAESPSDYCFPFRHESIAVLESAMTHDPRDARAPYYLGNLLYDIQPQRAVLMWEKSRDLDASFAAVHRNLAFAYGRTDSDMSRAIASIKTALECNPRDARFYFELDCLLAAAQRPHHERLDILEHHHDIIARRDDALLREIILHVLCGDYDRAIELLDSHHFHIWEGGENSAHDVFVDAHLLRGRALLSAGRPADALADFSAATEYPYRFEMGEPFDGGRSPEVCYLLGLAHEALGDDASARAAFERSSQKARPRTFLAFYQALSLRKLGLEDKALAGFDALIDLGREMLRTGPVVDFFGKFDAAQDPVLHSANAHYLVGLGLMGKGDANSAAKEFKTAASININHLGAKTMLQSPLGV